jgi:long-chain-fatty-acid--[acyl-carrier-protein] ligase
MKHFLLGLGNLGVRMLMRLRYKIEIKNLKELKELHQNGKPTIFLPNHPAEVDPIILYSELQHLFNPHPLVVERFYYLPGAQLLMKMVGAIPIPDFDTSVTEWKKKRGEKSYQTIIQSLKSGENLLIYPAGQLKRTAKETIGGSSMVHRLLNEMKDCNIVLVRISGLWGSTFSRAITGDLAPFWELVKNSFKIALKNGIFFLPRRKVLIEFSCNPKDLPLSQSRIQLNRYLEKFYNQYPSKDGKIQVEEPVSLVSYKFWKNEIPTLNYKSQHESKFTGKITLSEKHKHKILDHLREMIDDKERVIHETDHLSHQLGLDSLDVANIYTTVCKEFDVHLKVEPGDIRTVRDLFFIASQKESSLADRVIIRDEVWLRPVKRESPHILSNCTIGESFIRQARQLKKEIACKDATTPAISYERLLVTALVLRKQFLKLKGEYIGVMLPATVGVYAIILGLLLAKKVPVMLNWTVGVRVLKHAKELLNLETVLTSEKFLDKMTLLDITPIEDEIVLMEDIRREIGLKEKLQAAFLSKFSAESIVKKIGLNQLNPDSPAVVLFTSGTESNPKAVPLSHTNILKNLEASLDQIDLHETDILYGALPPFHSFGFSVTGLFPLLAGIRVFYAPDPTDPSQMAYDIEQNLPTMICLAPSFYKNLFKVAKNEQLKSIRLFVSGAEKAPLELLESVKQLGENHHFLEGYGITECSPVVSINLPDSLGDGVGLPLPNLEIKIIHPETLEEIDPFTDGEICIHGPSVFSGYLGDGKKDPFIVLEGKKFYRSGDIGHLDPKNYNLILSGRLKRFVKIGGEMVSLGAIETEFASKFVNPEMPPIFVVSPLEAEDEKTKLAVMTNCQTTKEDLNELLKTSGFGRIVKISSLYYREKIPVMGTGKIDYRKIDEMIKSEIS